MRKIKPLNKRDSKRYQVNTHCYNDGWIEYGYWDRERGCFLKNPVQKESSNNPRIPSGTRVDKDYYYLVDGHETKFYQTNRGKLPYELISLRESDTEIAYQLERTADLKIKVPNDGLLNVEHIVKRWEKNASSMNPSSGYPSPYSDAWVYYDIIRIDPSKDGRDLFLTLERRMRHATEER